MKIELLTENLNQALNIVIKAISSKSSLPILQNILFSVKENQLKLSATDLEIGINYYLPAKIEKEGEFTVPAKNFIEFISSLPSGKISLIAEKEKLKIVSQNYQAVFNIFSSVDFPTLSSLKDKAKKSKKIILRKKDFLQAVEETAFSAAFDESRPVLTAARLSFTDNYLQMVATDGYRLSLKKIKIKEKIDVPFLLIPASVLMEAARILGSEAREEENLILVIRDDNKQVILNAGQAEISSRLLEGEFPDFEKIIPQKGETELLIDREQFSWAIKASSVFARQSANIVKLKVEKGNLSISANALEVGSNQVNLEVRQKGENLEIAFNYRFLQDFLNHFKKDAFLLQLNGSLKPGVFKEEDNSSYLHLIMPVRLEENQ